MEKLYEGKAKILYKTENPDEFICEFKDSFTAFDGTKKDQMAEKGEVNAHISAVIFEYLESKGIPTHFLGFEPPRIHKVKAVSIIPVEVVMRNTIAGSISKRLGIPEGTQLKDPLLEFYYKDDSLHDPIICENHVIAFGWATPGQMRQIKDLAFKVNSAMVEFFMKVGLKLIDFKLEFGDHKGSVILADEFSPDTCRLWDVTTNEKMDKDRFRRDLGGVMEAYKEVARRIGGSQN